MVATASPVATVSRRPTNYPWIIQNDALGEDAGAFAVGGIANVYTAGATLLIGDAVFISAAFTVNKSVVAGDRLKRAGIVVGGLTRSVVSGTLEALQNLIDVGDQAAVVNDPILVCTSGICYAVADGVIAAGTLVTLSAATAGRVTAAASAAVTDAEGVLGQAIDAAAANGDKIRVKVNC